MNGMIMRNVVFWLAIGLAGINCTVLADVDTITIARGETKSIQRLTCGSGTIEFSGFACPSPPDDYGVLIVSEGVDELAGGKTRIRIGASATVSIGAVERAEFPIIRFPQGAAISADRFELVLEVSVGEVSGARIVPPWKLEVAEDGEGRPVLNAVRQQTVMRVSPNVGDYVESADKWSDGLAPHTGAVYAVIGSATALETVSKAFKGDELIVYSGQTKISQAEYTIPKWTLCAGGSSGYRVYAEAPPNGSTNVVTLNAGEISCLPEVSGEIVFCGKSDAEVSRRLVLNARLTGSGSLAFNDATLYPTACLESVTLNGDNRNYMGRMSFNGCMKIVVSDGTAFGGALASVRRDAVRFAACAAAGSDSRYQLEILNDEVIFDEPTRGWQLEHEVRINVASNRTLTINNPITLMCPALTKSGKGELALGGEMRFGKEYSVAPGESTDCLVAVESGHLRPLTADAFNGTYLHFHSSRSGIVIGWEAEGELREYGLRNVGENGWGRHFGSDNGTRFEVRFDVGEGVELGGEATHALITLPTDEVEACLEKFRVINPFDNARMQLTQTTNGANTTVSAKFTPIRRGFFLSVE